MNSAWMGLTGFILLLGCSTSNPTGPGISTGPAVGWHDAGLVLSSADQSAGGVQWLSTVGNRIIASTASGKVFLGGQGSTHWDSVPFPGGDSVYSQTAIDSSVYFGTRSTGQVWELTFPAKTWTNLQTGIKAGFATAAVANWNHDLAAFFGNRSLVDSSAYVRKFTGTPGAWTDFSSGWPRPDWSSGSTIGIGTTLFSCTYQTGLWRRSTSDTVWSRVPDPLWPEKYANDSIYLWHMNTPRALAIYEGNLWVGYLNYPPVYLTGVDTPWHSSKIDSAGLANPNLPISTMTLFVCNGRLFSGGNVPSTPMVYKDGTGWQYLSQNWGKSDDGKSVVCSVDYTFSFAAIKDTLYAAGCGHVFKLPWSLVPQ